MSKKRYRGVPEGFVPDEGIVLCGIYESPDGLETKAIPETQPIEMTHMLDQLDARRLELGTNEFIPAGDDISRQIVLTTFIALLLKEPSSAD